MMRSGTIYDGRGCTRGEMGWYWIAAIWAPSSNMGLIAGSEIDIKIDLGV